MRREYPAMTELKNEFGQHKEMPDQYAEVILKALYHYPELKEIRICFRLKEDHHLPYSSVPSVRSAFALKRSYTVTFLEKAEPPMQMALFKNLPDEAKIGVLAHELAHIVQYEKKGLASMIGMPFQYATEAGKRKVEREADIIAIEHGLGFELYTFACLIRAIPGYVEERKEIDINYLHPNEILEALPPGQLQELHTKL